jgi:L-cysteine desulfidase
LGVGSLPGLLFCGLGAVLGVIALVMAPEAEREVLASDGRLAGLSVIRVARICARLSIAMALIGLTIGVVGWFSFLHWADHHQHAH